MLAVREPTISYFTFVRLYFWSWAEYVKLHWSDYEFPRDFYRDVQLTCHFHVWDVALTIAVAIALTFARIILTRKYFLPWCIALDSPKHMLGKLPENLWKLSFYCLSWSWSFYVVFCRHTHWITDPLSLWNDWSLDMVIPWDIYIMYVVQFGFYIHSIYATIYLDPHRKDFVIMLVHHVLTLALIGLSYCANHYMMGAMVLFCHDLNDVFLELWKMNSNWRQRANGRYFDWHDRAAVVSFGLFISSWFFFRLYLFPLKVMYTATYGPFVMKPHHLIRFWAIFVVMLTLLLALNIYWFVLMVVGLYRFLVVGSIKVVEDVREFKTASEEGLYKKNGNGEIKNHKIK